MENIKELKECIRPEMSLTETIDILNRYIDSHPDDEEAYIMRGMKHWGAGKRSAAINDYLAAIRINPESRARMALQAVNEILDYRNKDLYNP